MEIEWKANVQERTISTALISHLSFNDHFKNN